MLSAINGGGGMAHHSIHNGDSCSRSSLFNGSRSSLACINHNCGHSYAHIDDDGFDSRSTAKCSTPKVLTVDETRNTRSNYDGFEYDNYDTERGKIQLRNGDVLFSKRAINDDAFVGDEGSKEADGSATKKQSVQEKLYSAEFRKRSSSLTDVELLKSASLSVAQKFPDKTGGVDGGRWSSTLPINIFFEDENNCRIVAVDSQCRSGSGESGAGGVNRFTASVHFTDELSFNSPLCRVAHRKNGTFVCPVNLEDFKSSQNYLYRNAEELDNALSKFGDTSPSYRQFGNIRIQSSEQIPR